MYLDHRVTAKITRILEQIDMSALLMDSTCLLYTSRSEPSSRAALTGEQPDPWDLLQPQDATSRHRGCLLYTSPLAADSSI